MNLNERTNLHLNIFFKKLLHAPANLNVDMYTFNRFKTQYFVSLWQFFCKQYQISEREHMFWIIYRIANDFLCVCALFSFYYHFFFAHNEILHLLTKSFCRFFVVSFCFVEWMLVMRESIIILFINIWFSFCLILVEIDSWVLLWCRHAFLFFSFFLLLIKLEFKHRIRCGIRILKCTNK